MKTSLSADENSSRLFEKPLLHNSTQNIEAGEDEEET
jgi:hypothetical protein